MNNKLGFDPSLMLDYNFDDGLCTFLYDINEQLSEDKVRSILVLVEKFYPGSIFKEDWFIQARSEITISEYIENYYVHRRYQINDVIVNIPVYIQGTDGILSIEWTKQLGLELLLNESVNGAYYGVTVYPYVYFDYSTINKKKEKIDQRKAAKKNRDILRYFLIGLEKIIGAKPIEITGGNSFLEKYLYDYGIKDGAEYLW